MNTRIFYIVWLASLGFCIQCAEPKSSAVARHEAATAQSDPVRKMAKVTGAGAELHVLSIAALKANLLDRKAALGTDQATLQRLDATNSSLCQRLVQLQKECAAAYPIVPSDQFFTKCSSTAAGVTAVATRESMQAKIEVALRSPATTSPLVVHPPRYMLNVNGLYRSSGFTTSPQTVTFSPLTHSIKSPPQFRQISSLILRADVPVNDPKKLPDLPDLTGYRLIVNVNGSQILGSPLEPSLANPKKEYIVPLRDFTSPEALSKCRVSEAEINLLEKRASDSVSTQVADEARAAYIQQLAQKPINTPTSHPPEQEGNMKEELIASILEQRRAIEELVPETEIKKDFFTQLENALRADNMIGCQAGLPLKTLEVRIDGNVIPKKKDWGTYPFMWPPVGSGSPDAMAIELAPNIMLSASDFKRDILTSFEEEAVIGDLEYFKIRKGGAEFENYFRDAQASAFFDSVIVYEVAELRRWEINKVEVRANEKLVFSYQFPSPLQLDSTQLTWTAKGFRDNPAWLELMQINNCAATE